MAARDGPEIEPMLTPGEVAEIFGVETRTIARWELDGRLTAYRTLGGHRRFKASEVEALKEGDEDK